MYQISNVNVKNQMSNIKCQMSIGLNFCQSVPPEFLRSFLTIAIEMTLDCHHQGPIKTVSGQFYIHKIERHSHFSIKNPTHGLSVRMLVRIDFVIQSVIYVSHSWTIFTWWGKFEAWVKGEVQGGVVQYWNPLPTSLHNTDQHNREHNGGQQCEKWRWHVLGL